MGLFGETRRLPRVAGAALGVCLAVAAIVLALPGRGRGGVLPATLNVAVRGGAAIAAAPAAPNVVLHAGDLRPAGRGAAGAFELADQAGRPVAVGLRVARSSTALDSLARVELEAGSRVLADTTLGGLRAARPIVLRPGRPQALRLRVWIPGEVETGYEGRHVAAQLVPVVRGEPGR